MMRLRLLTILVAVCAVMAFGSLADVATAEFMTVNNHSFELPVVPVEGNGWLGEMPDGWSGTLGDKGNIVDSKHVAYFPSGYTGDQAFLLDERWAGNATDIYQDLGSIGDVASYVTLMVDVARRIDDTESQAAHYTVQLEDADTSVVLALKYYDPVPTKVEFLTCSTDTVLVPAGTSIRVRLFVDSSNSKRHTFMDNVRVESNPIPEPSTLVLTVLGLIGLAAFIRRRK